MTSLLAAQRNLSRHLILFEKKCSGTRTRSEKSQLLRSIFTQMFRWYVKISKLLLMQFTTLPQLRDSWDHSFWLSLAKIKTQVIFFRVLRNWVSWNRSRKWTWYILLRPQRFSCSRLELLPETSRTLTSIDCLPIPSHEKGRVLPRLLLMSAAARSGHLLDFDLHAFIKIGEEILALEDPQF